MRIGGGTRGPLRVAAYPSPGSQTRSSSHWAGSRLSIPASRRIMSRSCRRAARLACLTSSCGLGPRSARNRSLAPCWLRRLRGRRLCSSAAAPFAASWAEALRQRLRLRPRPFVCACCRSGAAPCGAACLSFLLALDGLAALPPPLRRAAAVFAFFEARPRFGGRAAWSGCLPFQN